MIALYAGGRCWTVPEEAGQAGLGAGLVGRRPGRGRELALEVVGRRGRPEADRRAVALPIGEVVLDETRPVAEEDGQDARGERVERAAMTDALGRGHPPDEGDDVVGGRTGRLGDDEDAVETGAQRCSGHRQRRTSATSRPASARTQGSGIRDRLLDRGACRPGVAAATEPTRQDRRVDATRARPDAQPRAARVLLEEDGHLGVLGLGQEVDDALGERRGAAGRREVGVGQRRPDDAPAVRGLEAVQDPPEEAELGVGLRAVDPPRDVRERGAGLDQGGRDRQRPRGGVGVGEGRGVHDDAAHQGRRESPAVDVEGHAQADRQERDHLAGRGGGRIDPVGLPHPVVRGVVVDHDPRQASEELGVSPADLTDPIECAAVRDHHEVVVAVWIRVGPDAIDLREVAVEGRWQVGGDRIGRPAEGLDEPDDAQRRTERVGVGVLVADRQDTSSAADPLDHEVRHGLEVRA